MSEKKKLYGIYKNPSKSIFAILTLFLHFVTFSALKLHMCFEFKLYTLQKIKVNNMYSRWFSKSKNWCNSKSNTYFLHIAFSKLLMRHCGRIYKDESNTALSLKNFESLVGKWLGIKSIGIPTLDLCGAVIQILRAWVLESILIWF